MRGKWERKESERKENREERKLERKYNPLSCFDGGGKIEEERKWVNI